MDPKHKDEIVKLANPDVYKTQFMTWYFLLHRQFNIMVYGYGSKLELIDYVAKWLKESNLVITLNGLVPKINVKLVSFAKMD